MEKVVGILPICLGVFEALSASNVCSVSLTFLLRFSGVRNPKSAHSVLKFQGQLNLLIRCDSFGLVVEWGWGIGGHTMIDDVRVQLPGSEPGATGSQARASFGRWGHRARPKAGADGDWLRIGLEGVGRAGPWARRSGWTC